ncbi:MAG TPA: RNA polymerase sigma factor [Actinomycetota bacterium]|nr:RNA polymerase sigma factor [Actinomycetota bacterium]
MRRPRQDRGDSTRELVPFELVERCRGGDEGAWKELVELTHREVYTLCLRILNDPSDAAEATQDAYLKAWRGLRGFRGDAQFTTWLYRVASNAAISKHRSRKRRRVYEVGAEDELLSAMPAAGSVEGTAEVRRDVQELEGAIRNLPDHYRSAVVLRDVYGLSIEEIAKELKITETAAKVRVHRARKKLKETLHPTGDET